MMKWLLAILLAVVCTPIAISPPVPRGIARQVVSKEDKCLAWVMHDEARGESLRGARAVLDAVKTRMKKRKLGACEVIAQKGQFSGYSSGSLKTVTGSMLDRYEKAKKLRPVVAGCGYFHAIYVEPVWAEGMTLCASVGKHIFYKERKK